MNLKKVNQWFSQLVIERPLVSLLIAIITLAALVPGLSKLEADYDIRIWFRTTDPMVKDLDAFERQFGNDEFISYVVDAPSGLFTERTIKMVQKLTEEMWQLPDVIRVETLTNFNWTRAEEDDIVIDPLFPEDFSFDPQEIERRGKIALNHETIPNYLVDVQGRSTYLYGRLRPPIDGALNYKKIVDASKELMAKYEKEYPEYTFYLSGNGAINDAFREVSENDLKVILPILAICIIIFLYYTFRSVVSVMLPFIIIFASLFATLGLAGHAGIKFNNMLTMLPGIIIAISIADAVHILSSYYIFRRRDFDNIEALNLALDKNLIPTLLTSVTTSIGFFSLSTTELLPVRHLGLLAGFGSFVAWFYTMFILFPVFKLVKVKIAKVKDEKGKQISAWTYKPIDWIFKRKVFLVSFISVTFFSSIYVGALNEVNSDVMSYFTKDVPIKQAFDFTKKWLGGIAGPEIVIDTHEADGIKDPDFLHRVDVYEEWLNTLDNVNKTISIVDILKETNRSLHEDDQSFYKIPDTRNSIGQQIFLYSMGLPQGMDLNNRMTIKNDALRLSVLWDLTDSKSSLAVMEQMEKKAKELNLDVVMTGKMPLYHRMVNYVVETFFTSIGMAMVLVSFLMILLFKSVKLGLFAMLPNIIPIGLGAALMTIFGMEINVGSALVTSVCLGIAVDDTIHFLTNFYRNREDGMSLRDNFANIFTFTVPALFITTLILVVGFGVFIFGQFVPNVNFGILCALILTAAFLVDVIFLPAFIMVGSKHLNKSKSGKGAA